eukprot:TRINITY_DN1710_c0_g1_i1.p1 TRINITY_DN1710_c0_g1~~TRINITY_DN1710_c0_g1_i1.p1  ORF type:complete len:622 (-),score=207.16 TRINITY_DN1710_c0_g1_i1:239-2104(-)
MATIGIQSWAPLLLPQTSDACASSSRPSTSYVASAGSGSICAPPLFVKSAIHGDASFHRARTTLPGSSQFFVSRVDGISESLTSIANDDVIFRLAVPPVMAAGGSSGLAGERESENGEMMVNLTVPASMASMVPVMKKGYGSFGGGVTLERSKLELSTQQTKTSPQVDLGGGGGNTGNKNFHGGGDGGDDGGDDDDYFGEDDGDDGDEDGILRKIAIVELFDRATVEAVLQEWYRSIKNLPAGMVRAVELGLVSSAQIARFLSMDARPTIVRAVSRCCPEEVSRAFIGRMIADPAFLYKFALEQTVTIVIAAWNEVQSRGKKLKDEWEFAAANVAMAAACNAAAVWSIAPSRSYDSTARAEWRQALQKLPNNMFDKSYPLREFTLKGRVGCLFVRAAEMSLVGTAVGAVGALAQDLLLKLRQRRDPAFEPSMKPVPVGTSAQAYGAFLGLSANLRAQLLCGMDRAMVENLTSIPLALMGTTALRSLNIHLGVPSLHILLGLDSESQKQTAAEAAAYRRPSLANPAMASRAAAALPSFLTPVSPFIPSFLLSFLQQQQQPKTQQKKRRLATAASSGKLPPAPEGNEEKMHVRQTGVAASSSPVAKKPKRKVARKVAMAGAVA